MPRFSAGQIVDDSGFRGDEYGFVVSDHDTISISGAARDRSVCKLITQQVVGDPPVAME